MVSSSAALLIRERVDARQLGHFAALFGLAVAKLAETALGIGHGSPPK